MNKSLFATFAVVSLIATPLAFAEWGAYGSHEPDSPDDSAGFMWFDAPGAINNRVYFNAYTTSGTGAANPNVGALRSQVESVGTEYHQAILGVWTDCNGDGYIGLAETAAREYRKELLLDKSLCPDVTGSPHCWTKVSPCPAWPITGYNNYNGWVTELIPIGNIETTGGDKRVIKDVEAMVWGDYGRPDDAAEAAGGGTCAIRPLPRGTAQSTGGAINYVDCRTGLLERWNLVVDTVDPTNSHGLRFQDDDDARNTFVDKPTFGSDDSSNAIVRTGDCDSTPLANTGTAAPGDELDNRNVYAPGTSVNPNGNVPGTVNYTVESTPLPKRQTSDDVGPESTSNCDFSDDRGADFYGLVEGDFQGVSNENKIEADWNFGFATMTRGGVPLGGLTGSAGGPSDAGLEPINGVCIVCQESEWLADSQLVKPAPRLVRANLTASDVQPAEAYRLTFYAYVGSAVTGAGAALPGGTGVYGSAQCGSHTTGVHNGWNCDPNAWYILPSGEPISDVSHPLAKVGQSYNLRDVDCFDGTVFRDGDVAVGAGLPFYGTDPCHP